MFDPQISVRSGTQVMPTLAVCFVKNQNIIFDYVIKYHVMKNDLD